MENKNNNNEIKILNFDAGFSAIGSTDKKWYPIDLNVEAPPSPDYSQVSDDVEVEQRTLNSIPNNDDVVNSEIMKAKKGKMTMIYSEEARDEVNTMLRREDVANGSDIERKRKRDFSEYYIPPNSRLCRGPKVVIRVESKYEYVEDGYRWRKYGKKAIKGSPNPRGYFRCATQGCNVRKQVERDILNPRFVISTYQGNHKHPVPTSKFKFNTSTFSTSTLPIPFNNSTNNIIPIQQQQQPSPIPFSLHHRYSLNNYLSSPNYYNNFFNYANNTIRPLTYGLNYHHPYAAAAATTDTTHRAPDFVQLAGYGVKGAPAPQLRHN